jgi:hypothetical protein
VLPARHGRRYLGLAKLREALGSDGETAATLAA